MILNEAKLPEAEAFLVCRMNSELKKLLCVIYSHRNNHVFQFPRSNFNCGYFIMAPWGREWDSLL